MLDPKYRLPPTTLGGQYVFCVFLHGLNTQCIQCIFTLSHQAHNRHLAQLEPLCCISITVSLFL